MKGMLLVVFGLLLWVLFAFLWTPPQYRVVMKIDYPTFFFVETSNSTTLNPRQACAVESAARHHSFSNVTAIMVSSRVSEQVIDLFRTLPNVHIVATTLEEIFFNSSLEGWYKKGDWKKSKYPNYHLSDTIRLLLIWKYGGIYLDLDIVVLKSMYHLRRNFLVSEGHGSVANGILAFEPHHPLIFACLHELQKYYRPNCFTCIGPPMVTRILKSLCKVISLDRVVSSNCGVTVYPPITAFPVTWKNWRDYFDRKKASEIIRAAERSHMIHVWNKFSVNRLLSLNSGSAYEKFMQRHCPNVYKFVALHKLKF